jgi:hypothetical protein
MTGKDFADFLISLLQVTIWPVLIFFFLRRFHQPVSELITRLSEMALMGGSAKFHPPAQSVPPKAEVPSKGEVAGTTAPEDKYLELATQFTLWWWFEKIWSSIYRGQIAILERLLAAPENKAQLNAIVNTPLKMLNPGLIESQLPQYIEFLERAGFVALDYSTDANNPVVALTDMGRQFLNYMNTQGYTKEMKPY